MRTTDEQPTASEDPLDEAVAAALEAPDGEREVLLGRLESEDPAAAGRVRTRLALLGQLGFSLDAPRAEGWLPERFGRFTRGARVGRGGMSEVHLARDEATGELAAIKLVRTDHARFESARARFARELAALQLLDHPGLVHVLEVGEQNGAPWLALEWIGGASLEEVLDRLRGRAPGSLTAADFVATVGAVAGERPFPEPAREGAFGGGTYVELAARLVARVAEALASAHAAGVLHRDVKPANVLVTPAGRVVLVDFGLALPPAVDRLTREGSWLGSLPYSAPEQLAGDAKSLDERADVYALGTTLYELLTLRTPFLGGPEGAVRRRVATGDLEPPRRSNPAVPKELALVCRTALDLDPRRRPASARAFADELERALSGRRVRSRRAPLRLRVQRQVRRRPVRALVASVAVLVSLGALAFALRERARAERLTQLADAELVRGLIDEARAFWPPSSAALAPMDDWLERTDAVLARRLLHDGARASLAARALPYGKLDRARDQRDARAELATLARELVGLAAFVEQGDRLAPLPASSPERARALDGATRALLNGPPVILFAELHARLEGTRQMMERDPVRWGPDLPQLAGFERVLARSQRELATRATYRFDAPLDAWRHAALGRLLADLDRLAALGPQVREQLAATRRLAASADGDGRRGWEEARAAIAQSPRYGGLALEPTFGLVPLAVNAQSDLWEFLLADSGAPPDGSEVSEATGVVLVLLPGGRFRMGVDGEPDSPLAASAKPAHEVELEPFFIAKHELTIAQAERLGGLPVDPARPADGRLPVTIDWERAGALLHEHGLELPTEAQWEYAARAGGGATGPLEGQANLLDRARVASLRAQGGQAAEPGADFDDGWPDLAPVGSLRPNGFGLHDTLGNVAEWCLDAYIVRGYATLVPRGGDGLRATVLPVSLRAVRGGSFVDGPQAVRVELRRGDAPGKRLHSIGVRPVRALGR